MGIKLSGSRHFEYFLKQFLYFFSQWSAKSAKIILLRYTGFSIYLNKFNGANCTNFFWVSAVTTLRSQIVGSAIFHRTYSQEIYYGDFTLKQEIQLRKIFWSLGFLPKSPWLLRKSKTKYLGWVFPSSSVQRAEKLSNFVRSIEWIVNIK